ncbi:MAG UNVERIFIED_CONTAM: hypothetical protein LVR18_43385 [Planctomycetaceae bacterium]
MRSVASKRSLDRSTSLAALDGSSPNSQSLILNAANAGSVVVSGSIGATTSLNTLTLAGSGGATFGTSETDSVHVATAINVAASAPNADVRFLARLEVGTFTVSAGSFDLFVSGNESAFGTTSLLNTGVVDLGDSADDTLLFSGPLTATGQSAIRLFAKILTEAQSVTLGTSTTPLHLWANNISIDTTNDEAPTQLDGNAITIGGVIEGLTSTGAENLNAQRGKCRGCDSVWTRRNCSPHRYFADSKCTQHCPSKCHC